MLDPDDGGAGARRGYDIARRQIAAGALGVCCAKLGEAEAMVEAGIVGVLITSPVVTPQGIARLVALNRQATGLMQTADNRELSLGELKVVTRKQPSEQELQDLLFAWKVAKYVKSNAIVFCRDGMTIGVGAGQMSRVDSARIAAIKAQNAKLEMKGTVVASDAFFPFRDGLDAVAEAGVKAVIQPGGSVRDGEVIAAADEHGIAMVFTGERHFRH